jgi:hypothetical protein
MFEREQRLQLLLDRYDPRQEGIWELPDFWTYQDWEEVYPRYQYETQCRWDMAVAVIQQLGSDIARDHIRALEFDLHNQGWELFSYPRRPDPSTCVWDRCAVNLPPPQPAPRRKRGRPRNSPTIPWAVFVQLCDRYLVTYHTRPTREEMCDFIGREHIEKGHGVLVDPQTLSAWIQRYAGCNWETFWGSRMH